MTRKSTSTKPPKLGTVWTMEARIQVIDTDTMKWRTVARCIDTPNAVKATVAQLRSDPAHKGARFWHASCVEGSLLERRPLF